MGAKLVKSLREDFGITLAVGQDQWKGKVERIAHLGYVDTFDIIITISAREMALEKFSAQVELGEGEAGDQKILLEAY
jgi:aspartate aminotransferase-like enzyme